MLPESPAVESNRRILAKQPAKGLESPKAGEPTDRSFHLLVETPIGIRYLQRIRSSVFPGVGHTLHAEVLCLWITLRFPSECQHAVERGAQCIPRSPSGRRDCVDRLPRPAAALPQCRDRVRADRRGISPGRCDSTLQPVSSALRSGCNRRRCRAPATRSAKARRCCVHASPTRDRRSATARDRAAWEPRSSAPIPPDPDVFHTAPIPVRCSLSEENSSGVPERAPHPLERPRLPASRRHPG